ncbi:hypothetical protein GH714_037218 [Hevea brasiliensis]|uniref:Uncharacterized protein n=1 Tax=Hevea brasiliensis TaxID=3981 RepID=A0A6A6MPL1_HEVBR|nr:hypothetical protein GH714_037218 [Hevea brasiliensis]
MSRLEIDSEHCDGVGPETEMKSEILDGLDLSAADDGAHSFGIFSVKFSTDGRELVAGSSDDSIYVYGLERNKLSLRILAHAVCSQS